MDTGDLNNKDDIARSVQEIVLGKSGKKILRFYFVFTKFSIIFLIQQESLAICDTGHLDLFHFEIPYLVS